MRNIIDSINNLSKSFDTIHEEDDDIEEYDEETLVEEAESHQLKEEVLKKNIDYCPGSDNLSEAR